MHAIEAATCHMFRIRSHAIRETVAAEDTASPYLGQSKVFGKRPSFYYAAVCKGTKENGVISVTGDLELLGKTSCRR